MIGTAKKRQPGAVRSLHIHEWPVADRLAWERACQPTVRLRRGGAAAHLAEVSRADIANRYGLYLNYLQRRRLLDPTSGATSLVTPAHVGEYQAELEARVRSVTVWNSIYKLRRAAELIAPAADFRWLAEIEKDIALVMRPRNKDDRLVLSNRLLEAGLTLIQESERFARTPIKRACGVRNGLMIALLALHPLRIKNFGSLRIGDSLKQIDGHWWLHIHVKTTKTHRLDERRIPDFMTGFVDAYVQRYRPILFGKHPPDATFWVSSTRGRQFTIKNMGTLISRITKQTVGVDVSPHLFRMAAASTAAIYGSQYPHLPPAVLGHRDERVTDDVYDRSDSLHAGQALANLIATYRV